MMGLFANSWSNTLKFFNLYRTSRLHTNRCQRPFTLCISSKVKGFNGHDKRNEGFNDVHIHILKIIKEEVFTIYSSYQGYQGVGVPRLLLGYHDLIKNTNDHIMGHLDSFKFYTYSTHQVLFLGY